MKLILLGLAELFLVFIILVCVYGLIDLIKERRF